MQFTRIFAVFLLMGSAAQAQNTDWSGFYGGVNIDLTSVRISTPGGGATTNEGNGLMAGLEGGYRFDLGDVVLGATASVMFGGVDVPPVGAPVPMDPSLDAMTTVGVEAGYDVGPVLVYGGVGYTWATMTDMGGTRRYDSGTQFGIGADYMMTDTIMIGGGVTRTQLDNFAGSDVRATSFGVRAALRF